MALNCVIVDDEKLARQLVQGYISKIPGIVVLAACASAAEALPYLQNQQVDLLFLDIQMPEITGIEFITMVKNKVKTVIFTTAYSEFALKGYELGVTDYLVKPFSFERFLQAVLKAQEIIDLKNANKLMEQIPTSESKVSEAEDYFFAKSGTKQIKIKFSDILYIEGMKEYVALYLADKSRILLYERMKNMEEKLSEKQFVRVHKSYIVALRHIKELDGGELKVGDAKIPMSKPYSEIISNYINKTL